MNRMETKQVRYMYTVRLLCNLPSREWPATSPLLTSTASTVHTYIASIYWPRTQPSQIFSQGTSYQFMVNVTTMMTLTLSSP